MATDPEVLLLIEAVESGNSPRYRYAFARFHYWELSVSEGDRTIWSAPLDKAHELNAIGDVENMNKTYNSFNALGRGVPLPTEDN